MTNTIAAVDWAVMQMGANGIEVDVQFDQSSGVPVKFSHGEILCDCVCDIGKHDHVCHHLDGGCKAATEFVEMCKHIATRSDKIGIVVLDSKVDKSTKRDLQVKMGRNIIEYMVEYVIKNGYEGNIIVGMPSFESNDYLLTAVETVGNLSNQYQDQFVFSIDGEGNEWSKVIESLINLGTKKRVFGTGITSCVPGSYEKSLFHAHLNSERNVVNFPYIWSIDKESSMRTYLKYGAEGIMTNFPGTLTKILQEKGKILANSTYIIPASNSTEVFSRLPTCDCDYHPGGCRISKPAVENYACNCIYKDLEWTCYGEVVLCDNFDSAFCINPGSTKESCQQGGGDCGGY